MRAFSSQDLRQQFEEIQHYAATAPVVIVDDGKPESIMMSVDEFRRLKEKAGEVVAGDIPRSSPVVRRIPMRDPLGYSTTDIMALGREMAEAALSGRNREAVQAEIAAVERRLGLR